jgi:hypothetical protein
VCGPIPLRLGQFGCHLRARIQQQNSLIVTALLARLRFVGTT